MTETSSIMTTRQHLEAIANGIISEETREWARGQIEKLDARNSKRKEKPTKTAIENAPIKETMLDFLTKANGNEFTENDLGEALKITHNKAGSLARQLVQEGKIQSKEVKIPKVGKRKAYFIPIE